MIGASAFPISRGEAAPMGSNVFTVGHRPLTVKHTIAELAARSTTSLSPYARLDPLRRRSPRGIDVLIGGLMLAILGVGFWIRRWA